MEKRPVARLEQALAFWENSMVLARQTNEMARMITGFPMVPAGTMMDHWEAYRGDILHIFDREFPFRKYSPDVIELRQIQGVGTIAPFAHCFYAWSRYSRRVFNVTRPLQALLNATTLQDISWRDVRWPFESFLITLEVPIIGSEGEEYDAIFFARLGKNIDPEWTGDSPLQIMLLPKWFDKVTAFTPEERNKLTGLLRARRIPELTRFLKRVSLERGMMNNGGTKHVVSNIAVAPKWFHVPVSTSFQEMHEVTTKDGNVQIKAPYFAEWDAAARVLVGLSFYLTTSGKAGPQLQHSPYKIRLSRNDPRAIRLEGEITSVYAGDPPGEEEITDFLNHRPRAPGEVCASFVMGYWKRPPGQGNDPTAAKTVWVRPHLRRQDRLKSGELPGGLHQDK